jgi:hypothetical protein
MIHTNEETCMSDLLSTIYEADFRKSSFSDPDRECVEIGHTLTSFGIRDSKVKPAPVLVVIAEQGRAFVGAVKAGHFDL